jgi:thiamine pyrophosphate-dependent acetolactate synthase large subunit-like protein
LINAIVEHPNIEWVLMRNELNAGLTAAAYAKLRGGLGCMLGTSGPGSSHLTTGVIEGVEDKLPLICLTGMKKTNSIGFSDFQDIRQTEIFRAAGCYMSNTVVSKDQVIALMRDSLTTALTRGTTVHLAIPIDVQLAYIFPPGSNKMALYETMSLRVRKPSLEDLKKIATIFTEGVETSHRHERKLFFGNLVEKKFQPNSKWF